MPVVEGKGRNLPQKQICKVKKHWSPFILLFGVGEWKFHGCYPFHPPSHWLLKNEAMFHPHQDLLDLILFRDVRRMWNHSQRFLLMYWLKLVTRDHPSLSQPWVSVVKAGSVTIKWMWPGGGIEETTFGSKPQWLMLITRTANIWEAETGARPWVWG